MRQCLQRFFNPGIQRAGVGQQGHGLLAIVQFQVQRVRALQQCFGVHLGAGGQPEAAQTRPGRQGDGFGLWRQGIYMPLHRAAGQGNAHQVLAAVGRDPGLFLHLCSTGMLPGAKQGWDDRSQGLQHFACKVRQA